jgi:hypothetical protein
MIRRAVAVLVIDTPAAIACSAPSSASGSRVRVLLPVWWCPFLLILKPERRRAYDPSPVGRLCGRSEDDLSALHSHAGRYCRSLTELPIDNCGHESAISTHCSDVTLPPAPRLWGAVPLTTLSLKDEVAMLARRPTARERSGCLPRGPDRRAVGRPGRGRVAASRPSWRRR